VTSPRRRSWRDRRWAPPGTDTSTFWLLLAVVVVLNLIGLVMVLSASSVVSLDETGSTWSYFFRQSAWAGLGAIGLLVFLYADRSFWRRWAALPLFVSIGLLVLVLVPGVGVQVNGATRWLALGPIQIQPSELAKLTLLLFVADLLTRRAKRMHDPRFTVRTVIGYLALVALLILAQPNLGTTLVLVAMVLVVLWVADARLRSIAGYAGAALGAAALLVLYTPYRRARFFAFLDPWADPGNTGYQTIQSMVGIADGGVHGSGLGASRAKWGFLPYAHTDFIFAIIGEELGLIGSVLVVALFLALAGLGVRTALRADDRFAMLCAAGVTAWLLSQALINIGAVLGMLPITGVPLPFISFGGSSLLVNLAAVGLLLNVARHPRARSRPAAVADGRRQPART
jgi:cell division protein FtsW